MKSSPVQLKLKDISLVSVLFHLGNLELEKEIKLLKPELSIKIIYDDTGEDVERGLVVFLTLEIGDLENIDQYPFSLSITYNGVFSFTAEREPEKVAQRLGIINCAAIIFPFLREEAASIVLKSTKRPFLLPPINFYKYFTTKPDKVEFLLKSQIEK